MSVQPPQIRTAGRARFTLVAQLLLVPYAIALGLIVWLPASEASKATGIVFAIARLVSDLTGIDGTTSSSLFEFLSNIVLFVPLGILVALGWPQSRRWYMALLGFATSTTIELVQVVLPSRLPTLSDVIANTVGAVIGFVIARLLNAERSTRTG